MGICGDCRGLVLSHMVFSCCSVCKSTLRDPLHRISFCPSLKTETGLTSVSVHKREFLTTQHVMFLYLTVIQYNHVNIFLSSPLSLLSFLPASSPLLLFSPLPLSRILSSLVSSFPFSLFSLFFTACVLFWFLCSVLLSFPHFLCSPLVSSPLPPSPTGFVFLLV